MIFEPGGMFMSGSGGGGGGFDAPAGTCQTLVIDTQLISPKQGVVEQMQVGDILTVKVSIEGDITTVVVMKDGAIAGGLTAPLLQRLRQCIDEGTQYTARVTAKKEGLVRVRVSAIQL